MDDWLVWLRRRHELHLTEIAGLRAELQRLERSSDNGSAASAIAERMEAIYESRSDEMYVEFRKKFRVEKLPVASQAKLDEIYYELTKLKL